MVLDTFVAVFGLVTTAGLFGWTYRDASRVSVSRPVLWAGIVAGAFAVGLGLYLFATVPMTGVILTANTGLVLYGFEREVVNEDDEPAEPGTLPERE
ncbi:hypothetical protein [Natronobacterium gregoryi]|uniref:Uncharacterized protein n=2 Tax=Natronobacterium gregoryi TaxID=44930 RepID=L0AK45_NATGS|nr:hypothetical protein [Natronobacterium gregoryi]AFZ73430.1 hypothetical protein Natgr_2253 [Natronobacterium gregoryi SP2]ELY68626.1 hypothetical protein C490_09413 [Natronobacterium gregoryi SP2]PLK20461.1 hypothetical protein CYV19_09515 [Natronobacterium gregoryi SP2]SFI72062.1 hypothetical protein SAMN05443661_10473 [Natronobacterium gregoryi]